MTRAFNKLFGIYDWFVQLTGAVNIIKIPVTKTFIGGHLTSPRWTSVRNTEILESLPMLPYTISLSASKLQNS